MCGGPTGTTNEYCVVLDASLHHMWYTNSTHDFPMNPVGSLQDILINFTGLPSDSIRVPRGCQYGIFGSSRIPFGFPWGSHSLLIWFLWTLSGFPKGVHEPDSFPFSQICNLTSRASGFVECPSKAEKWLVEYMTHHFVMLNHVKSGHLVGI